MRAVRVRDKAGKAYGASVCPICNRYNVDGGHLHEVFFKRSAAFHTDYIFSEYNTVVVHPECHVKAHTKAGRLKCAKALLDMYGYRRLLQYIESSPFKAASTKNAALGVLREAYGLR